MTAYLEPTQASGRAFFMRGIQGPVMMLNLLRFRDVADYSAAPHLAPPQPISGAEAYALYVAGSSMEPRYRPGDPLFVDPKRPPAIGDDVVVQLRSETGGDVEITAGLIKTLARRTGSYLELEQYQPAIRFRVPMERVAHIHRVIPPKELFGF